MYGRVWSCYVYFVLARSTYTHHASRQEYVFASCLTPDIYWKNSMNNHVILKGVDVEVIKVIQLASEVHN